MSKTAAPITAPTVTPVPVATGTERNEGPDRHGHTYKELLETQARQLRWWQTLLAPEHYKALEKFCQRKNRPCISAAWPNGLHEVPRGVQLTQFLQERAQFILHDDDEIDWQRDQIPPKRVGE